MTAWWSGLAPVVRTVSCADQQHEIRWSEGVLSAPAHPHAERERALSALGADPTACVQILDAWNTHETDLDVLVLASRGPGDRLDESRLRLPQHVPLSMITRRGVGPHTTAAYTSRMVVRSGRRAWWGHSMTRGVDDADNPRADGLPLLLSLGSGLPHRLSAAVIAAWADRIEAADDQVGAALPALDAALYGRLRAALLPWLGIDASVEFTMLPPQAEPVLRRDGDTVHVGVPFGWLRDVWVNGFAITLDRFCVHAEQSSDRVWTLTTVGRDLDEQQTVTVSG